MPMYKFQCKTCEKNSDEKESFSEHDRHPEVKCPYCGSTEVVPVLVPVGVITAKKS